MTFTSLAIALGLSLLAPVVAHADGSKPSEKMKAIAPGDLVVLARLHHVNQMEIGLARLASKRGTSALKDYTATLITDHTSNDADITALAKQRGAKIPVDMPTSDADKAEMRDMDTQVRKLEKLKGNDFDIAYLAMMVKGHDSVVAKIDIALAATTDDDIRNYLTMTKPAVQLHAKRARDLQVGKPRV